MAHENQQKFCLKVKELFPEYFNGVNVCDIGSLDINGNNHFLFENYSYIGLDIGRGKNVNVVSKGHLYRPIDGSQYDVVISTECFEHDMYWKDTITNVSENLLRSGGLFVFSCATTGRHEHGTRRTSPDNSPFTAVVTEEWADYYMNLTEEIVCNELDLSKWYTIYRFYTNDETHDLYFWGIKK